MKAGLDRTAPLVRARGLTRTYLQRRWGSRRGGFRVRALDGVDLDLAAGSITAVVGESGSGKSTLARCLTLVERPDGGTLTVGGRDVLALAGTELAAARRRTQLIHQDAAGALNPRLTVAEILEEPLVIGARVGAGERRRRALAMLDRMGLPATAAIRRPGALSGGQRQRLVIGRALMVEPTLLVLDESFAGQDLSLRARIANLLLDLRSASGLTQVFVSHDMSLVRQLADRVAVLENGRLVESGEPEAIFRRPRHPHTRALIEATPVLEAPA